MTFSSSVKKVKKFMIALAVVLMGLLVTINSASAATGSPGTCSVTVWTDATNYYQTATTVDWRASKPSSTCGQVNYKATVYQVGDGLASTGVSSSGYFSTSTPVKTFNINTIKRNTPYPSSTNTYRIVVQLYNASGSYIGQAESANFYLH